MSNLNPADTLKSLAQHSDTLLRAVALGVTDETLKSELLNTIRCVQRNAESSASVREQYSEQVALAVKIADGEAFVMDDQPHCEDVGEGLWVACHMWVDKPEPELSDDELQEVVDSDASLTPEQRENCILKLERHYQSCGKRVTAATLSRLKALGDTDLCTRLLDAA